MECNCAAPEGHGMVCQPALPCRGPEAQACPGCAAPGPHCLHNQHDSNPVLRCNVKLHPLAEYTHISSGKHCHSPEVIEDSSHLALCSHFSFVLQSIIPLAGYSATSIFDKETSQFYICHCLVFTIILSLRR